MYNEVLRNCIEYFDGDELAAKVVVDKYLLKDEDGKFLEKSPDDIIRRITSEIVRIENKKFKNPLSYDEIYEVLNGFNRVIPAGSVLFGCGNKHEYVSLANCYLIKSPEDSYSSIIEVDKWIASVCKRRGGVGFDISAIRPAGLRVQNSARTTSGIVPFMQRYSNTINEVGIHGRRAAGLISIDVRHPQCLDFVRAKVNNNKLSGVNISVKLTDEFMDAVKHNKKFIQKWPIDSDSPAISKEIDANDLFNEICKAAHQCGDPGILFIDTIHKEGPPDQYEEYQSVSTNPCGEVPLEFGGACRLLSINLVYYITNKYTNNAKFDEDGFRTDAIIAQRIQDDIVDIEIEHLKRILKKVKKDGDTTEYNIWKLYLEHCQTTRRTGTGLVGIADACAAMGFKYGDDNSIKFIDKAYKILKESCYQSSIQMAEELGAFDIFNWDIDKNSSFIQRIIKESPKLAKQMKNSGRRNIALLATAPTGSLSIVARVSSGIEPVFKLQYNRRKRVSHDVISENIFVDENGEKWEEFSVTHPELKKWQEITGKPIEESPWYGCTAHEIDPHTKLKIQAAAQKHVDGSISSTVNLPNNATVDDIKKIYIEAYNLGLKGITIFRDGCKSGIFSERPFNSNTKRPKTLKCDVYHPTVNTQRYYVIVGLWEDGSPYEVFAGRNGINKNIKYGFITRKKKGFYKAEFPSHDEELSPVTAGASETEEIISRLTSLALRGGVDIHRIVQQLEKVAEKNDNFYGFSRAIARTLKKYIKDGTTENIICPNCGANKVIRAEGCPKCLQCGWTRCL